MNPYLTIFLCLCWLAIVAGVTVVCLRELFRRLR
jgi:hypothetical protein